MKSGMLAAEAAFRAMSEQPEGRPLDLGSYETALRGSWVRAPLLPCPWPAHKAASSTTALHLHPPPSTATHSCLHSLCLLSSLSPPSD